MLVCLLTLALIPLIFAEISSEPHPIEFNPGQWNIDNYAPGVLLVRASDGEMHTAETILASAHTTIGASVLKDYKTEGITGLQLVSIPSTMNVSDAVAYYSSIPGVKYAEPDYFRSACIIPNDPDFWRQWGLSNTGQIYMNNTSPGKAGADINAAWAWNTSTGGKTIIAVVDSGVDYLHPDLADNIWTDPKSGTHGYDAITGTLDPMDLGSHGTHCAGIIGAVGNNRIGVAGVNWNASIMPIRFMNSFGHGTVSDGIEGILWASGNGATIFSCSYGGPAYSQAEYEVISGTKGLFICAAGNIGSDNDISPFYPVCYNLDNIIAVAATNASDERAEFSNYGRNSVDIGAPGEEIYSTKHNRYRPSPIWRDPFDSVTNWTTRGIWTLDPKSYTSPPTSVRGFVNNTIGNHTPPAILTLNNPLSISPLQNPIISYELEFVGVNCTFKVEGSVDNWTWTVMEYESSPIIWFPFLHRECKIPSDLLQGPLYLRFVVEGEKVEFNLDDITLSDGYGNLTDTRYDYMSGTSMAAPQVSGMAGTLSSLAPDAPLSTIKDAILKTADPIPSLNNKTTTGGRANLTAAINYLKNPQSEIISLYPGWNHVSVAKRLKIGNDTAFGIFGNITNTSGHSILKYFNSSWMTVSGTEIITPLSSYWIYTTDRQNLTPITDASQNGTYRKDLITGWNGFGVVGTEILPAKTRLRPIGDNWTYIIGYDALNQIYYEPIIRGGSGNQSDTRELYPWNGYWLYVPDMVTYQITI